MLFNCCFYFQTWPLYTTIITPHTVLLHAIFHIIKRSLSMPLLLFFAFFLLSLVKIYNRSSSFNNIIDSLTNRALNIVYGIWRINDQDVFDHSILTRLIFNDADELMKQTDTCTYVETSIHFVNFINSFSVEFNAFLTAALQFGFIRFASFSICADLWRLNCHYSPALYC